MKGVSPPAALLATLVLSSALGVSCSGPEATQEIATEAVSPESSEDARLNEFLDDVFERRVADSPVRQSRLGRKTKRLGEWDDVSDAFAKQQHEKVKADLANLREAFVYEALSADGQLSYDLFVQSSETAIDAHEFRRHFYVVDQFRGQVTGLISVLLNTHKVETVGDAEDYVSRIVGLQNVLEEYAHQLGERAEFGVLTPAFSFPAMIEDAHAIAGGDALDLDFRTKVEALPIDDAARAHLIAQAEEAIGGPFREGLDVLIAEMVRLQSLADANGNKGVWSLPNGEAFYQNRIRAHTTLDMSAEEIHEIGLAEVARIHEEMRAIKERVEFEGDLRAFFDFIRVDPNNYFEASDAGREAFLEEARLLVEEIYAVVGDYFHHVPKASIEVRRVEPWRENSTSIAFYEAPSEDGTRPGIYYANLADMRSVQKYVFTAITYHESVPGHHFQIALAQELPGLPKFRRFGSYTVFTEGWALYAEKLAKEMGFYRDPYRDFGRLQNEIWRSVRLVTDTGIHAKRWTRQQAIDYFLENTPLSEGDIITEVERYFVNPGQALSYKMGMIKIEALRDKAQSELGDVFDIRDFHQAVIGAGSLPLDVLEAQVERYIVGVQ